MTTRPINFLALGLALLAGPVFWPGYFAHGQLRSASWLALVLGLQVAGAACVALADGLRRARRTAGWIEESLEISLSMTDLPRTALPASFYAGIDESEEEVVARRLQKQLLRAA